MADSGDNVLVQVCVACGKEVITAEGEPTADLRCEKCGGTVFRAFQAADTPGEAAQDFADSTERDLRTDDSAADVARGDLRDLRNL